jgi:hypothetical protein
MRILTLPRLLALTLLAALCVHVSRAMTMLHYDLHSLVFMSTDIVIADISSSPPAFLPPQNPGSPAIPPKEDPERKFTATVTETLYGSLQPGERLDTLSPFLMFFRPMEDGIRVILFLDRRPHQYDFFHSDAAKSPFAVPPSGVYLIDTYGHVHEHFQQNNPGPYVAQGYVYFPDKSVPTKEQDLALPSLEEAKERISAAVKAVEPVRTLLSKTAAPEDAPALMHIVDTSSKNTEDCGLRTAMAIIESAVEHIHALNDPDLLLKAYSTSGYAASTLWVTQFIQHTPGNSDQEFEGARVRFLLDALSNQKLPGTLRVAAIEILLNISKFHDGSRNEWSPSLPIDNPWLARFAGDIQSKSQSLFDDASQNPQLRGLSLQFLDLPRPEILADAKLAYAHTHSPELQFAIERAFLSVGDDAYASLNPAVALVASRISPTPLCGCSTRPDTTFAFQLDYQARKDFQEGNAAFARPYAVMTSLTTGRRFIRKDIRELGGWRSFRDGQFAFDLGPISDLPTGIYSLSMEYLSGSIAIGTSYGLEVSIYDTPRGKALSLRDSRAK